MTVRSEGMEGIALACITVIVIAGAGVGAQFLYGGPVEGPV